MYWLTVIYLPIYTFIFSQVFSCIYKYVENKIIGISNLIDLLDKQYFEI